MGLPRRPGSVVAGAVDFLQAARVAAERARTLRRVVWDISGDYRMCARIRESATPGPSVRNPAFLPLPDRSRTGTRRGGFVVRRHGPGVRAVELRSACAA